MLAIEPGDEKHLDGAPTIPVALLKVRSDTSHARAEALNIHCGIRGVAHRGEAHLVFRRGGATGGADFSVRPRLRGDPSEGVGAIGARRAENVVIAFREKVAAFVLEDIGVTALHGCEDVSHIRGHAVAHVPEVEVVGSADPDGGHFARGVFGTIDVGRQANAVAHRHHDSAIDDGGGFELPLGLHTLLALRGRKRSLLGAYLHCYERASARDG